MKFLTPFLLAAALLPLRADLLVQPHDRVLVATQGALDQGMVSVDIAAYFLMCQPVEDLTVITAPGDELEQFVRRFPTQLAPWNPNVALISHGISDGRDGKEGKGYTQYHPTYLAQTFDVLKKAGLRTILVGSATAVDTTFPNAKTYNDNLAAFRDLDRDLAAKAGLPFVDLFGATLDAMTKAKAALGDSYVVAANGMEMHRNGSLVETWAFLKALGADGSIGTITVDLAANTATGTPGQQIVSVQNGAVNVESTRYPFCFVGGSNYKAPNETADIINYFPFNQDLNRYLLVVKGLTAAKAKVTWGSTTKEFTAAQLTAGINLAAEFAGHTPFDGVFSHICDAIWQRQRGQFVWTGSVLAFMDDYKKMAPDASLDPLIAAIHEQDEKNGANVKALVKPVDHTIKIEPEP